MSRPGSARVLPNEWDLEIGQRLKEVRLAHDFTQDDFADRLGQRRSNWSMVETGRQAPAKEAIARLCDWLGLTFDYVYRGREAGCDPHTMRVIREHRRKRKLHRVK